MASGFPVRLRDCYQIYDGGVTANSHNFTMLGCYYCWSLRAQSTACWNQAANSIQYVEDGMRRQENRQQDCPNQSCQSRCSRLVRDDLNTLKGPVRPNFFGRYTDRYRASFRVASANPPVKDRTNCVNALLRNHAGQHRLQIDPRCKQLIKDFEQVSWKADPHGNSLAELDKSDPMRTHASDAAGYFVAREFPMRAQSGERAGPQII